MLKSLWKIISFKITNEFTPWSSNLTQGLYPKCIVAKVQNSIGTRLSWQQDLFFLFLCLFWPCGMWNPSSPTRDPTCAPCAGKAKFPPLDPHGSMICNHVHVCVLSRFSWVRLFATLWTVAHQAPLSMGTLQARILEWIAISFSRRSSLPRDQT